VIPVGPAGFAYITIIGIAEWCFAHGCKPSRGGL
jgi:hypothetical protein